MHHFNWWPGLLISVSPEGRRLGTFVSAGWIRNTWPSSDGRHLFIVGASKSRDAYFLAVLDAANPSGRSPELPGSLTECVSCPAGDPLQYLVFPRSEVSRQQPFPEHYPTVVTLDDGLVQVHVMESADDAPIAATIYDLAPAARASDAPYALREARFNDAYWNWHRQLEAEGRLNHPAADCPERRGLDVEDWTPGRGWTRRRVAVR